MLGQIRPGKQAGPSTEKRRVGLVDRTVVTALIGVAGIVVGTVLKVVLERWLARGRSKEASLIDIRGQWQGKWYVQENGETTLYNTDTIDIEKQSGFNVFGRGRDEKGTYLLRGEFSSVAVACFSYKYEKGLRALTGVVIMEIDPIEKKAEGWWCGYTKEKKVQGGRAVWEKIA
jgi:hypothetical protein